MEQEPNNPEQDDQAWFAALTGKTQDGQGAQLRRTLIGMELADAVQEDTTHDWQRLQFAIRREIAQSRRPASHGIRYFALAASVLIIIAGVRMLTPSNDMTRNMQEAGAMRGESAQIVRSANPAQDAQQLEAELSRLGVKVSRRAVAEKIELHITLAYPVKGEVRAVLERRVIPVPEEGDLVVVYLPD